MYMKCIGKLFKNEKGITVFIGKDAAKQIAIPHKQRLIVEYDKTSNQIVLTPL